MHQTKSRRRQHQPASKPLTKEQKKEVKKIVEKLDKKFIEPKQFVTGQSNQPFIDGNPAPGSPNFLCLTQVTQGNLDTQRVGDEIYLKHIQLRLSLYLNFAGTVSNPYVNARVIVFQYKNDDMLPAVNHLLLSANGNVTGGYGTFSARNIDYMNTYHVLFDRVEHLEAGSLNAANYGPSGRQQVFMNVKIPMRYCKKKIQYQAATTNHTNSIWLLVTSDAPNTTNNPVFAYDCNVNFIDP